MIWQIAPKHVYHSPQEVMAATALAVGIFNDGLEPFCRKVLANLGVSAGNTMALKRRDSLRQERYKKRSKQEWKAVEKKKRKARLGYEDKAEEEEGDTYEPGSFGPDGQPLRLATDVGDVAPAPKKARQCRTCHGPMKGHKRGRGCPPY